MINKSKLALLNAVEADTRMQPSHAVRIEGGFWKRHLDQIGVGGSLFAALCCLGFPALVSIVSAVGLGFLIRDADLIPLLLLFLALTLVGLFLGMRHHHQPWALVVGAVGALNQPCIRCDRTQQCLRRDRYCGTDCRELFECVVTQPADDVSMKSNEHSFGLTAGEIPN